MENTSCTDIGILTNMNVSTVSIFRVEIDTVLNPGAIVYRNSLVRTDKYTIIIDRYIVANRNTFRMSNSYASTNFYVVTHMFELATIVINTCLSRFFPIHVQENSSMVCFYFISREVLK